MITSLIRHVGAEQMLAALGQSLRWFPLVLALELLQLALDATASYWAYGERRQDFPLSVLARAQLIGTAVANMLPMGRTTEEATKAALLTPYTGGGPSLAAAATNQAVTLASNGLISFPCALASWELTGLSWTTDALLVHGVVLVVAATLLRGGMRARRLGEWLKRRFSSWSAFADAFQTTARVGAVLPFRPLLSLFLARVVQIIQYAVLLRVTGLDVGVWQVLMAQGLHLLAAVGGTIVPAQLGVSDALFVASASLLGGTEAQAMSVALQVHLLQICVLVAGTLAPVVWRVRPPARS